MTRTSVLTTVVIAVVAITSAGVADEQQERAENLRRKAAELVEQGRKDEARRLEQEALKTLKGAAEGKKSADRRADAEIDKLEEHLRDLRAKAELLQDSDAPAEKQAELKEQIARIERELDERRAGSKNRDSEKRDAKKGDVGKRVVEKSRPKKHAPSPLKKDVVPEKKFAGFDSEIQAAQERVKHVLAAAEHLDAAGMKDLAHELRQHAERMEQEIRQRIEQHQKPAGQSGEIRELRDEVRRLREELQELREKIGRE